MNQRRSLASPDTRAIPVSARALYSTEEGVFAWPGVPLVRKRHLPGGGVHFTKCDPQTAWDTLLPWHGEEVNGSALAATLTSACAYLNSGDAAEARKWVDRLPLPPLRPDALAKINNMWVLQPRAPNFKGAEPDKDYPHLPRRNVANTRLGYDLYNSRRIGPSAR